MNAMSIAPNGRALGIKTQVRDDPTHLYRLYGRSGNSFILRPAADCGLFPHCPCRGRDPPTSRTLAGERAAAARLRPGARPQRPHMNKNPA